jgi:hypothetical protein
MHHAEPRPTAGKCEQQASQPTTPGTPLDGRFRSLLEALAIIAGETLQVAMDASHEGPLTDHGILVGLDA